MGNGYLPAVKRQKRGVDHPPSSSAEVKKRVELYHYFPSRTSWPVLGYILHLQPHFSAYSLLMEYTMYQVIFLIIVFFIFITFYA